LATAADLLRRDQFGIATVVAHMACEVATERAFVSAFRVRNIGYLEDSVGGFLNGYGLAADRNRKLYVSLTDDDIQTQPFWQTFKESAARRNQVMHKGLIVDRASAQQSIDAANALVQHLAKRASNLA
jgi:predicted DNA-binding ribbon-helix-helix protein